MVRGLNIILFWGITAFTFSVMFHPPWHTFKTFGAIIFAMFIGITLSIKSGGNNGKRTRYNETPSKGNGQRTR